MSPPRTNGMPSGPSSTFITRYPSDIERPPCSTRSPKRSSRHSFAIGVLEDLHRHVGVGRRQRGREIGLRLAVPAVGLGIHLEREDVARPAVLHHLTDVPIPRRRV